MSEPLAHDVAQRLSTSPNLLHPGAQDQVCAALRSLAAAKPEDEGKAWLVRKAELTAAYALQDARSDKVFAFADGYAVIPVSGVLINRFSYSWSFVTGYNFILNQARAASLDPDVEAIVLDVNSPGGTSAGCAECAAELREIGKLKPIIAIVDAMAYSAAMWIASAATKIILTPSGGAGSIGAYRVHYDLSGMYAKAGIKITYIAAGKHKVDGNEAEPLSKEVKDRILAGVEKTRLAFATTVAEYRGLTVEEVLATEAECYDADDALRLGLVDAIASPSQALSVYQEQVRSDAEQDEEDEDMTTATTTQPAPKVEAPDAAAAAAAQTAAVNAAVQAERERITGIQGCDEAKDKPALAAALAATPGMSVESAKVLLAAAGSEKAEAPKTEPKVEKKDEKVEKPGDKPGSTTTTAFDNAMGTTPNPDLKAGDGGEGNQGQQSRSAAAVAALGWGGRKKARA